jgi:hypothetical protein
MTFLGFSSKSWDKAKKKRHDKHIKDDPQFYKKRQARYDKSKKLDKCLKNNQINTGGTLPGYKTCKQKYGANKVAAIRKPNNNPSTRGKQMKPHK